MSDHKMAILLLIFSGLVVVFGWLVEQFAARHYDAHKKTEQE